MYQEVGTSLEKTVKCCIVNPSHGSPLLPSSSLLPPSLLLHFSPPPPSSLLPFSSTPPLLPHSSSLLHHTYRYKSLTSELSETLKLWPGYVYWARGQLKLAADTFAATIDALKHCKEAKQVIIILQLNHLQMSKYFIGS